MYLTGIIEKQNICMCWRMLNLRAKFARLGIRDISICL